MQKTQPNSRVQIFMASSVSELLKIILGELINFCCFVLCMIIQRNHYIFKLSQDLEIKLEKEKLHTQGHTQKCIYLRFWGSQIYSLQLQPQPHKLRSALKQSQPTRVTATHSTFECLPAGRKIQKQNPEGGSQVFMFFLLKPLIRDFTPSLGGIRR